MTWVHWISTAQDCRMYAALAVANLSTSAATHPQLLEEEVLRWIFWGEKIGWKEAKELSKTKVSSSWFVLLTSLGLFLATQKLPWVVDSESYAKARICFEKVVSDWEFHPWNDPTNWGNWRLVICLTSPRLWVDRMVRCDRLADILGCCRILGWRNKMRDSLLNY